MREILRIAGEKQVVMFDSLGGDPKIVISGARRSAGLLYSSRKNAESGSGMSGYFQAWAGFHLPQISGSDSAFDGVGARLDPEAELTQRYDRNEDRLFAGNLDNRRSINLTRCQSDPDATIENHTHGSFTD